MSRDTIQAVAPESSPAWTPSARIRVAQQLSDRLTGLTDAVGLAECFADCVRDLLRARTVTIIALMDGKYFDIVNVGYIPPGNHRYPTSRGYPTWEYPLGTETLALTGGYYTTDLSDPHFEEYVRVWDDPEVTSVMGAGIFADDRLHGEVFITRDRKQPPFAGEDLALVRELEPSFGPAFVAAMKHSSPTR